MPKAQLLKIKCSFICWMFITIISSSEAAAKSILRYNFTVVEDTELYEKPDLDSKSLASIDRGFKFQSPMRKVKGYTEFYEVIVRGSRGYLLVSDVIAETSKQTKIRKQKEKTQKAKLQKEKLSPSKGLKISNSVPLYDPDAAGPLLGFYFFNQNVLGKIRHESFYMIGVKLTGDNWFIKGPILDYNFAFITPSLSQGAQKKISTNRWSGFGLYADLNLAVPLLYSRRFLVSGLVGPQFYYQNYKLTENRVEETVKQMSLGLSFGISAALRLGSWAIKLEPRYSLKSRPETSLILSIQGLYPE